MTVVRMNFSGNRAYSADDENLRHAMTLDDLIAEVEEARDEWGGDAVVVLYQTNNRGANYGTLISSSLFEDDADEHSDFY